MGLRVGQRWPAGPIHIYQYSSCVGDRDGLPGLSISTSTVPCLRNSVVGRRMGSSELKLKQPHKFFPFRLFDFADTTQA